MMDTERTCVTCRHNLGGRYNNCRINLEAECAAGGGYEAWEDANMKTYDGISVGDMIRAGTHGRENREVKHKKLVNMTTTEYPELASKLLPCPFCGGGFRFFREVKEYDNGDRVTGQYYLHEGRYNSRDYCPMLMMEMRTLGAGDADPENGRIGELAQMWNRRYTGCADRDGRKLFTGDIVVYEDAEADHEGYHDNVYEHPGKVVIDEISGTAFTERQTVDMDDLFYEFPNRLDCRKIGNARDNPEHLYGEGNWQEAVCDEDD